MAVAANAVAEPDQAGSVSFDTTMPVVGTAIAATLTDPDGGISGRTWQWASSDVMDGTFTNIANATSASYTPVAADVSKYLRVMATYTDTHRSNRTAMAVTANAVAEPPELMAPTNLVTSPAGSGIINVRWDPVAGAAGYTLIATNLSDRSAPTRTAAADADDVSGQIQNLTAEDEYLVFVGVFNDQLEYELSEYVRVTAE